MELQSPRGASPWPARLADRLAKSLNDLPCLQNDFTTPGKIVGKIALEALASPQVEDSRLTPFFVPLNTPPTKDFSSSGSPLVNRASERPQSVLAVRKEGADRIELALAQGKIIGEGRDSTAIDGSMIKIVISSEEKVVCWEVPIVVLWSKRGNSSNSYQTHRSIYSVSQAKGGSKSVADPPWYLDARVSLQTRYFCDLRAVRFCPTELPGVLINVVKAVRDTHKAGYIHGDIAARNVLLQQDTNGIFHGYLNDFICSYRNEGAAVRCHPNFSHELDTCSQNGLKCPRAADIFALGVLIGGTLGPSVFDRARIYLNMDKEEFHRKVGDWLTRDVVGYAQQQNLDLPPLPPTASLETLLQIFEKHGQENEQFRNHPVAKALLANMRIFVACFNIVFQILEADHQLALYAAKHNHPMVFVDSSEKSESIDVEAYPGIYPSALLVWNNLNHGRSRSDSVRMSPAGSASALEMRARRCYEVKALTFECTIDEHSQSGSVDKHEDLSSIYEEAERLFPSAEAIAKQLKDAYDTFKRGRCSEDHRRAPSEIQGQINPQ